ncbi:MAG: substrate-binding domain-containing protein [Alphaproteobacteria bacterium]
MASAAVTAAGLTTAFAQETGERYITVSSTTSTENSGLFGFILPLFTADTGIAVRVVAVGTGQAIKLAGNGDADVLFVHHRPSEEQFVADGLGVARFDVMFNDFVVVGPKSDPAGIAGLTDAAAALQRIARSGAPFASRGDDSGTHKKELELWQAAGIPIEGHTDAWYRQLGSGMGPTLNSAAEMNAYVLTDRGTWLSFSNKRDLVLLAEGDPRLFNPYGVILVNPARFPHTKAADGQTFIDWLVSPRGQQAIADFRVAGQPLFFPNAAR